MVQRIGRGFLILILTAGILLGAYLGTLRFQIETQGQTVELAVDLNDLKKMAAFEKKPLAPILDELKNLGFTNLGVFEETLPEASAAGELYCAKGSGILNVGSLLPVFKNFVEGGKIKPDRTYLYVPSQIVRKRIYQQLSWALGSTAIKFLNSEILEVDEPIEEIQTLGLGISEIQKKYLQNKGFKIIPRVWNDPRYHLGNIELKVSGLSGHDLIIFDGEEILGYPDALPALASALKKYGLKYGYIEIVKQDGDSTLRKMMGQEVVRVHSVPKDELKKLSKEEVLDRFVRAVRERGVRLIYLRPFLPPQIDSYPVAYNLKYFQQLKEKLESAGIVLGRQAKIQPVGLQGWQILVVGSAVVVGVMFLLESFFTFPIWLMFFCLLLAGLGIVFLGTLGCTLILQKILAFSAAVVFPSYAVISSFSKLPKAIVLPRLDSLFILLNVLAETLIGAFLIVGILFDYRFMMGVEVFPAVKLALVLPILLVATNFILKTGQGRLKDRLHYFLNMKVSLLAVFIGSLILGALGVLVLRSGNFTIPVPAMEKYFRNWLEAILYVRPRTKEFLVGYPFLLLAAVYYLKGGRRWLWLLLPVGTIAPVSVLNTFSHIHTPILITFIRTFNGLVLGILIGILVVFFSERFFKEGEK